MLVRHCEERYVFDLLIVATKVVIRDVVHLIKSSFHVAIIRVVCGSLHYSNEAHIASFVSDGL